MKLVSTITMALLVLVVTMSAATATTFLPECGDDAYRTEQADIVFTGTVDSIRTVGLTDKRTQITFLAEDVEKGDQRDSVTIEQPAGVMIPSITLDWEEGQTWRVQAKRYDSALELVCGQFGREWAGTGSQPGMPDEVCAQVITYAQNPETDEVEEFPTPCDVPQDWPTIIPTEPDGGIGDGATPPEDMCVQVITFAVNPDTQAVERFPTPCDVPRGWEVVDEPIPVEPDGGIGDGGTPPGDADPIPIEGPGGIGDSPGFFTSMWRWLSSIF